MRTEPEASTFVRGNDRLADLLAKPGQAERVDAIRREMDAEDRAHAMNLATVRKASELTQVELAKRLGVGQGVVSRIEHSEDLLVSTLLAYLDAAGVQDVALTANVAGRHVAIDLSEIRRR